MLSDLEYIRLFDSCVIAPARVPELNMLIDNKILAGKTLYTQLRDQLFTPPQTVPASAYAPAASGFSAFSYAPSTPVAAAARTDFAGSQVSMPWYVVACLHYHEQVDLNQRLRSGRTGGLRNPLSSPGQRMIPISGALRDPVAAIRRTLKGDAVKCWTLPNILRVFERHNSDRSNANSSDLWSGSNHPSVLAFRTGFPPPASATGPLGAAVVLKGLENRGIIQIPRY
ncbi:hypothetical protein C7T94_12965 [Pedobacter yulinensis]|uniref:Uncharacterized protein n=1 Tax=Pedobacter yulinensis TaxID=2126353 RepID=A0A2T3HLY3_9SPHI|nr:hypothetical protein [Pedobacter yulinensis]PST83468.1 hypothetical protein C7T94_12965 [Pedobacter yulinensis]